MSTAIMLLYGPEHVTAANLRKRRLCQLESFSDHDHDRHGRLRIALQRECWLLESLLTSPLNKHTKSPTLWSHKYWLDCHFASNPRTLDELLNHQWPIVSRASDIHPRNYYAWSYMRKSLTRSIPLDNTNISCGSFSRFMENVQIWCTRHPSDISGWTFLLFMMRICHNPDHTERVVKTVLATVVDLKMSGEACWAFVKETLSSDLYQATHHSPSTSRTARTAACRSIRPLGGCPASDGELDRESLCSRWTEPHDTFQMK